MTGLVIIPCLSESRLFCLLQLFVHECAAYTVVSPVAPAGLSASDVVYLNLQNACEGALPFYVAVDAPNRAVVVAVRGTFSIEDTITDVLCLPVNVAGWLPSYMKVRAEGMEVIGQGPLSMYLRLLPSAEHIMVRTRECLRWWPWRSQRICCHV
jgi:hypothetical protein